MKKRVIINRLIETGDGTLSLYSSDYDEAMHSLSGAYEEALLKHVYPSRVINLTGERIVVLDIGFGLGYNVLALLSEFLKKDSGQFLQVISLERDLSHAPLMAGINFEDERDCIYDSIRIAARSGSLAAERYSIEIIPGDARCSLKEMDRRDIDAVFHDPYSPSKNPELWTVEFFKELRRVINGNGILTTYSSALQIRMALMEAGFTIGPGPSVGKKREGTIATVSGNIKPLNDRSIVNLKNNSSSVPYRDLNLQDTRESILQRRIGEMKKRRAGILALSP
jgi:tRNA U34 5-methylaminomethyl-2-thiouridine-forming methyltransferase MnmC